MTSQAERDTAMTNTGPSQHGETSNGKGSHRNLQDKQVPGQIYQELLELEKERIMNKAPVIQIVDEDTDHTTRDGEEVSCTGISMAEETNGQENFPKPTGWIASKTFDRG
eukprot:874361-Heterocapsa_arctica.AAC.1